jgi:hypothetical protein
MIDGEIPALVRIREIPRVRDNENELGFDESFDVGGIL